MLLSGGCVSLENQRKENKNNNNVIATLWPEPQGSHLENYDYICVHEWNIGQI